MSQPNILFVLTDDHGAWAMGCAGNREVRTPNLDALAAEGTRFENFFCVSPVCSPARASIFSGKIPSQHGVHDWLAKGHLDDATLAEDLRAHFADPNAPWYTHWPRNQLSGDRAHQYLAGHRCFTEALSDAGYYCGLSGKWHIGDSYNPQCGFDWWQTTAIGGENYFYPVVLEEGKMRQKHNRYVTDHIADNAIHFLDERPTDRPFYLSVHFTAPHSPWSAISHPNEYLSLYEDCPFESTPNVPPHPWGPKADIPLEEWRNTPREGIRFIGAKYGPLHECWQEHRRESLRGYYAALTGMDCALGRIIDRLKAEGVWENTLVVFTADNGMNMGHHGLFGKGNATTPVNMYDTSVKVPAIFRLPDRIKAGAVRDEMVSHYDLYPTLLRLAEVDEPIPADLPGADFTPLLEGGDKWARDAVIVCDEYGPCRMIRTHDWKYVARYPAGPDELYDLRTDPGEEQNRIDDPACADVIAAMREEMDAWFDRYVDPAFDGTKENVRGKGQLTSHSFK